MATFTWTATTGGGTPAWETIADWVDQTSGHPLSSSFTTAPGNDYVVDSLNTFTITEIGAGGTSAPDIANSLTLARATLLLHDDHGALDVTTTLSLGGLLNLGTAVGGSVLSMGGALDGGTISLGAFGRLEGALGDSVQDIGTLPTEIIGSGTVLAQGGLFTLGSSVEVPAGTSLQFQINPSATLSIADAVGSGTIVFSVAGGSGVLDVAKLSTFNASVKNLFVGTVKDTPTTYIDFLNVGTTATATLTGITSTGATLTVFTGTGSHTIPILGNYLGKNANVNYISDGNGGTNVFITNVPCYATGTAILTPAGEVAVETIQAGDVVMTSEGDRLVPQTVTWAGNRDIDIAAHPKPGSVAPIRFRQGALGVGLPRRDLLLSPDHCLFIDGGLVPAKLLVNGMTITRDLSLASVSYHHVELERHAVLIAEGVPAESYLDTGNRACFGNAGLAMVLHPEFNINEYLRCWETDACAPLMARAEQVLPLWERFADRSRSLGYVAPAHATTTDPALCLIVDGRTVRPLAARRATTGELSDRTVSFLIPEGAASVRLVSRRAAPVEARPWQDDPRILGVAVRCVTLRDRTGETVASADHPALIDGWHAAEFSGDGAPWRWTAGDAVLPIVSDGPCLVEITLATGLTYLDDAGLLAA
jgi:antigen 43